MQLNISKEDLAKHRALRSALNAGEFKMKGDALLMVATLFKWYDDLGSRMNESLSPKPEVKEKSEPIKKIGKK